MNLRPTWPLKEGEEIKVRGLWRIPLPDGKHPESKLEYFNQINENVWLLKEGFTRFESCAKKVKELNEWKRQRGGRQIDPNKPNPKEYLKHDYEVQHITTG